MGVVYLVRDPELKRLVAIKVVVNNVQQDSADGKLQSRTLSDAEKAYLEKKLELESRITSLLAHPSIVPMHDYLQMALDENAADRSGLMVMQYVEGITMKRLIDLLVQDTEGKVPRGLSETELVILEQYKPLSARLDLMKKVCDAVAFAHDHELCVVHRDIKPANIMIGTHGEVFLMDWGIANITGLTPFAKEVKNQKTVLEQSPAAAAIHRMRDPERTGTGDFRGTETYASPEQLEAKDPDAVGPPADIFALGCLLYSLVTLQKPVEAAPRLTGKDRLGDIWKKVRDGKNVPLARESGTQLPSLLKKLILTAVEFDPTSRPTAPQIKAAIEDYQADRRNKQLEPAWNPLTETGRLIRRHTAAFATLAVLGIVIIILYGFYSSKLADSNLQVLEQKDIAEKRERDAVTQLATSLMLQGTTMLRSQDPRGVCYLVESLRKHPVNNPALTALLVTLNYRGWAWPVENPVWFTGVHFDVEWTPGWASSGNTGMFKCSVGSEGSPEIEVKVSNLDRFFPITLQQISPTQYDNSDQDKPDIVEAISLRIPGQWERNYRIGNGHVIKVNQETSQWAVWDEEHQRRLVLGPVQLVGDLPPIFCHDPEHDVLAVISRHTTHRAEFTPISGNAKIEIFSLQDRFAVDWPDILQPNSKDGATITPTDEQGQILGLDHVQRRDLVRIVFSPDHERFAAAGSSRLWIGSVLPWHVDHEADIPWAYPHNPLDVFWSPNSRFLILGAGEEALWWSPGIVDLRSGFSVSTVIDQLRIGSEVAFSHDSFWVFSKHGEGVEMFDIQTQGNLAAFTVAENEMSFSGRTDALASRLLLESGCPNWLLDLSLAIVGWKLDNDGALLPEPRPKSALDNVQSAIEQCSDSVLKEWAVRFLMRLRGQQVVKDVCYYWSDVSEATQARIRLLPGLQVGASFQEVLGIPQEFPVDRQPGKSSVATITVKPYLIGGGVGLDVSVLGK
ncbi:MAG: serine/threonine protein kinase [Verrucomicrobiaceae bacterium]|nr:serine/threonine protein kinase [Verrucomicrobiaceae bacterium]